MLWFKWWLVRVGIRVDGFPRSWNRDGEAGFSTSGLESLAEIILSWYGRIG